MAEWIAIDQWQRCAEMARPGIVFEVRNADKLSLFTSCVMPLPDMPFDWQSPAVEFRPVAELPPRPSAPLPEPGG